MANAKWRNQQEIKEQKRNIDKIESRGGRASDSDYIKAADLETNRRDLNKT